RGLPDCWAAARAEEVAPDLRDCAAVPADQAIRSPGLARSFGSTFSSSRHVAAQRHWPYVSRITPVFSIMSAMTPPRRCGYGRETPDMATITTRSRWGWRGFGRRVAWLRAEGGSPSGGGSPGSARRVAHLRAEGRLAPRGGWLTLARWGAAGRQPPSRSRGARGGRQPLATPHPGISPPRRAPRCRRAAARAGSGVRYPLRRPRPRSGRPGPIPPIGPGRAPAQQDRYAAAPAAGSLHRHAVRR